MNMGDPDYDDVNPQSSKSAVVQKLAGLSVASTDKPQQLTSRWLDAWSDPVAGISAYTPCIHTCNLFGDGDWRLVVADHDRKLKVCNLGQHKRRI